MVLSRYFGKRKCGLLLLQMRHYRLYSSKESESEEVSKVKWERVTLTRETLQKIADILDELENTKDEEFVHDVITFLRMELFLG